MSDKNSDLYPLRNALRAQQAESDVRPAGSPLGDLRSLKLNRLGAFRSPKPAPYLASDGRVSYPYPYANLLSVIYFGRPENRYRELGIQISRDAIAAGANDITVYSNLARELVELGRIKEAREIYAHTTRSADATIFVFSQKIRQRSQDYFEAQIHHQQKEYAKADEIYRRLIAAQPLREDGEFSRYGRIKLAMNQFDEAVAVYNDGLKWLPKNCNLWQELGTVYVTKGDVATALATFDKGIAAVPKYGLSDNEAARLLIKQNRVPEAKQKLDALIKIAPNSDGAVIAKEILACV